MSLFIARATIFSNGLYRGVMKLSHKLWGRTIFWFSNPQIVVLNSRYLLSFHSLHEKEETRWKSVMSYWLTRVVFLRCLAAMYTVAFLVALLQNEYLLGEEGLTPATIYIQQRRGGRSNYELVLSHPTVFWVISPSTANINLVAVLGLCLSVFVAIEGCANMPIILAMWALYFSIVSIGQTWYSFGWESQLLETGFLTAFMVPLLSLARFPRHTPTPWVCIWGLRWLLFRIMIGAGMIKIRGDECWRDLTCMNYHYQTQPVPNPLSVYFHNTPGEYKCAKQVCALLLHHICCNACACQCPQCRCGTIG